MYSQLPFSYEEQGRNGLHSLDDSLLMIVCVRNLFFDIGVKDVTPSTE